jgi:hypothetical protein
VESLGKLAAELQSRIDSTRFDSRVFDADAGRLLLREIADVFHTIVRTVQDNCQRIASEVTEFRGVTDLGRLRGRLSRLIELHDEYLRPIIRMIDISGDFHDVTDQVSRGTARLAVLCEGVDDSIADEARLVQQEVTWLRQAVLRCAEEARHELAPLCQSAIRESRIATGVHRALEAIRANRWTELCLEQNLAIVDERDGALFSDLAVERYWRMAVESPSRAPPKLPASPPASLALPVTPADLVERLDLVDSIDDLLGWILDTCDELALDGAVSLFQQVIELRPHRARYTNQRLDYQRGGLVVNAARWNWKGSADGDDSLADEDGRPAPKARRSVPRATKRKAHLP